MPLGSQNKHICISDPFIVFMLSTIINVKNVKLYLMLTCVLYLAKIGKCFWHLQYLNSLCGSGSYFTIALCVATEQKCIFTFTAIYSQNVIVSQRDLNTHSSTDLIVSDPEI